MTRYNEVFFRQNLRRMLMMGNSRCNKGSKLCKGRTFCRCSSKGWRTKEVCSRVESPEHPEFLRLLEQATMEYGFQQKGVLAVPCRPEELQNVLKYKRNRRISTEWKSKPSFSLQKEPTSVYVSKVASLRQQFFFWRRDGWSSNPSRLLLV